ncbi:hypothetical protein Ahy_B01g052535 [Arachis hypogaea]|uniref:RNA polymerase Rpb5 N-terminal domain-containing protein n=1 Tax=Arachis hypogaea TaxID=3818 RepID=A0A445APQ9_ARAHY|nr:hypothetical protein Ahy_B01g052535 [Arachis hypogaea]
MLMVNIEQFSNQLSPITQIKGKKPISKAHNNTQERRRRIVLLEEEINRLYRIRKTMMQMLSDRDYLVEDLEIKMCREEFRRKYGKNMKNEDLIIKKYKEDNSSDQIYVFFLEEAKVGVKTLKTYTNRMNFENVFRFIMICQQNLTPFSRTCINEVSAKFYFEVSQVCLFL